MEKARTRKIGLIGCGMVGMSFVYSLIHRGLNAHIVLIDMMKQAQEGQALDTEDACALIEHDHISVASGSYKDLGDADLVLVTAGRPQKPGETRLAMVHDNVKIVTEIGNQLKKAGFKGILIVASNPVDVLTMALHKVVGLGKERVIGSGTVLDSARLRVAIAKHLKVSADLVKAILVGEHGDSSVLVSNGVSVNGKSLASLLADKSLTPETLKKVRTEAAHKAYDIIAKKRVTHYGIGVALANIAEAILKDTKEVLPVGVHVKGIHGIDKEVVIGYPAVIGKEGIVSVPELKLTKEEERNLAKSAAIVAETAEA